MEEEIGKEGPICSIFLAEFHPDIGPIISYQYPGNRVTKEVFDAVNVYIIPKAHIQKQVITVNVLEHKITGYPNEIKNQKYARNALIFNLCFVCESNSRTVQYEPVVKKLSEYLENLELENQFLSSDDTRCQLPEILKKIFEDLNAKGSCTLSIRLRDRSINEVKDRRATMHDVSDRKYSLVSERRHIENDRKSVHGRRMSLVCDRRKVEPVVKPSSKSLDEEFERRQNSIDGESKEKHTSILHLKVVRVCRDPARVYDYHVPILVSERMLQRTDLWDLTTQQILSYIDGYSHVAKIAAAADVENNLVKLCVQNLLYYGVVQLLPIFQYSNSYTVTGEISRLYKDRALQEECQRAVCKNEASPTYFSNIMKLYCSMTYGVTIRDLCVRFNPQALNIDERKLVQFGLLKGLVRRLHQYPVWVPTEESQYTPKRHSQIHKMCDGAQHTDEICCKLGIPYQELCERIDRDPNIFVLWK